MPEHAVSDGPAEDIRCSVRSAAWPLGLAILAAVTLAAWWPATGFGLFTFDDDSYVFSNARLHRLDLETVRWALLSFHDGNWNPVSWLAHAVNWQIWGAWPGGHHRANVVLHTANTVLVAMVARRLSASAGRKALVSSLAAGLLFGLHPVQAEAVVWIAQLRTLLAGFFSLLTVLAWLRWADGGRRIAYAAALILFALALMSKASAVALPLLLVALLQWPTPAASAVRRRALCALLPFLALAAGVAGVTLLTNQASGALDTNAALPVWERALASLLAIRHYLLALVWPPAIAPLHPFPTPFGTAEILEAATTAAILAGAAFGMRRWRNPCVLMGAAWLFIGLLPVLGPVRVGLPVLAADRYLYFPCVGLFIALAATVGRRTAPAVRTGALVLAAGALLPCQQAMLAVWRTDVGAWDRTVAVHPDGNPTPYILRGNALSAAGRPGDALADCNRALMARPDHRKALLCRGQALLALGRVGEAVATFDTAIAAHPDDPLFHNERGTIHFALRRFDRAEGDFRRVLDLGQSDARAHFNLAGSLAMQGKAEDACAQFGEAVRHGQPSPARAARQPFFAPVGEAPCWRALLRTLPAP